MARPSIPTAKAPSRAHNHTRVSFPSGRVSSSEAGSMYSRFCALEQLTLRQRVSDQFFASGAFVG